MFLKGVLKGLVSVYFYVGVNVIGIPQIVQHFREVYIEGKICQF